MIFVVSVVVSFIAVFLRSFQHKNVIGNHYRSVFLTSYAIALFDVASVYIIIQGGFWIALTSGTGAAFGMVTGMYAHDYLFKKKRGKTQDAELSGKVHHD